jgi:hypothetical protein
MELHRARMIHESVVRVAGAVLQELGHGCSNCNSRRRLTRGDMGDGRENGTDSSPGVIEQTADLLL